MKSRIFPVFQKVTFLLMVNSFDSARESRKIFLELCGIKNSHEDLEGSGYSASPKISQASLERSFALSRVVTPRFLTNV